MSHLNENFAFSLEHHFSKVVYIVDGTVVALSLALIKDDLNSECIYEIKKGIDDSSETSYLKTAGLLLSGKRFKKVDAVTVPSPYFLGHGISIFKKLVAYIDFVTDVGKAVDIENDVLYVGSSTSSIMKCIPVSQRYFVDHGAGDYLKRTSFKRPTAGVRLANFLLKLTMKVDDYFCLARKRGFTLCKMKEDYFHHLDIRNYMPPSIVLSSLDKISKVAKKSDSITLVLPTSKNHGHKDAAVSPDFYVLLNFEMIKKTCKKNELIVLKYHSAFYFEDRSIEISLLIELLNGEGYEVINFDNFVPNDYKGHVPAEIVITTLNVSKVVAEQSSALFNAAHIDSVEAIAYPSIFDEPLKRQGWVIDFINSINPRLMKQISIR